MAERSEPMIPAAWIRIFPPLGRRLLGLAAAGCLLWAGTAALRAEDLAAAFRHPPEAARPWVYWYWVNAAVSRAGITADLEAMKREGIGGAYLMPVGGVAQPPLLEPPVPQLSPAWWAMVRFAMQEADRVGIKLAMHACDGFTVAGGPWITPALSMQKVVWTRTEVDGGRPVDVALARPEAVDGYYRDIAVLAFPAPPGEGISTRTVTPTVTTSLPSVGAEILGRLPAGGSPRPLVSKRPCWIQYAFAAPFTCRAVTIRVPPTTGIQTNTYFANRLTIAVSDDGVHFREIGRLVSPRHGWQDGDATTHAIPAVTARYFRFGYDPAGAEPGAEDLDSAKWEPVLRLTGLELSSAAHIDGFEGKAAECWRVGARTTVAEAPGADCVPLAQIQNLTDRLDAAGRLVWTPPPGRWTVLRIGHTSTGSTNYAGGAAVGLECDKFNPAAARLQFDHWFGAAIREVGPELAGRVLKVFHVDSWEAGSQNWSPVFRAEFIRRRGYDPVPYLPAMAGVPVQSADVSERFLHDLRQTIAELVVDNFFRPMADLAHAHGCVFSAECVAATMVSDDLRQDDVVDLPMGEFWLRSPTHDKLNDILDAVSGAHIYGKPIAQAEAFTELQLEWDEQPALLKPLADRNFTFGINRFVFHVFVENPWPDRRPGLTLGHVGTFFQRNQTWRRPGRAWVDYVRRCQALLQTGRPVADVAVFTGEELPSRAVLPERLLGTLPGIFGPAVAAREAARLANRGEPQDFLPDRVEHSANLTDPADWVDPLHGYAYDSINRDALLRLATVRDGRIVLPGGASYGLLVLPAARPLAPDPELMSPELAARLRELVAAGATVLLCVRPDQSPSLQGYPACDAAVQRDAAALWPDAPPAGGLAERRVGRGRVIAGPYREATFDALGLPPDCEVTDADGRHAGGIGWIHRTASGLDLYFLSNQRATARAITVSLRITGRVPELWDAVTGDRRRAGEWRVEQGRTVLPLHLDPNGSIFVVLREPTAGTGDAAGANWPAPKLVQELHGPWQVAFDPKNGGPPGAVAFERLEDWTQRPEPGIRYYSGTADYALSFDWRPAAPKPRRVWLDLGRVENLAAVSVNGVPCGVAWTAPWRVDITAALRPGTNTLRIAVTNTWANRLIGDQALPEAQRLTWTTAPFHPRARLLPAGLLGPVTINEETQ
jgi:(4-O-methyl)-D-glucuronate---lignin esterase